MKPRHWPRRAICVICQRRGADVQFKSGRRRWYVHGWCWNISHGYAANGADRPSRSCPLVNDRDLSRPSLSPGSGDRVCLLVSLWELALAAMKKERQTP